MNIHFKVVLIYIQNSDEVQSEVLTPLWLPTEYIGRSSASLVVDSLGWCWLFQFKSQGIGFGVAPQSFDCLLLYSVWNDTQILQTGQARVLHV